MGKKRGPPLRGVGLGGEPPSPVGRPVEGPWVNGTWSSALRHLEHLEPFRDLAIGFVAGDPIALLDLPDQLLAAPLADRYVVIGEPAPLLARLASELLPRAFNLVPIHRFLRGAFRAPCLEIASRAT